MGSWFFCMIAAHSQFSIKVFQSSARVDRRDDGERQYIPKIEHHEFSFHFTRSIDSTTLESFMTSSALKSPEMEFKLNFQSIFAFCSLWKWFDGLFWKSTTVDSLSLTPSSISMTDLKHGSYNCIPPHRWTVLEWPAEIVIFSDSSRTNKVRGFLGLCTNRMNFWNFSSVQNCVHKGFLIKLTWLPNLALSNIDLVLLTDKPHTQHTNDDASAINRANCPYLISPSIYEIRDALFCKSESTNRESVNKVQPDVRRQASTSLCSEQRNMKSCNNLSHSFASAMRNGCWNCNFSYTLYVTSDKN